MSVKVPETSFALSMIVGVSSGTVETTSLVAVGAGVAVEVAVAAGVAVGFVTAPDAEVVGVGVAVATAVTVTEEVKTPVELPAENEAV